MKLANGRSTAITHEPGHGLIPGLDDSRAGARRLLETAVVAFAERGYHGVSVRDLTSAIGIQAGSFYSHFDSKEELLFQIVLLSHERHQATVREALLAAGADPADQLRGTMRANVCFIGTYPYLSIVGSSELHALSPQHRERVLHIRQESAALVAAIIERGNAMGAFACAHPWIAVSALGGMGMRLAWWFRTPDRAADKGSLNAYTEAADWLPGGPFTLERMAAEYAEYALKIVSYRTKE
jgi:AcrR family transcriptional regulator